MEYTKGPSVCSSHVTKSWCAAALAGDRAIAKGRHKHPAASVGSTRGSTRILAGRITALALLLVPAFAVS